MGLAGLYLQQHKAEQAIDHLEKTLVEVTPDEPGAELLENGDGIIFRH